MLGTQGCVSVPVGQYFRTRKAVFSDGHGLPSRQAVRVFLCFIQHRAVPRRRRRLNGHAFNHTIMATRRTNLRRFTANFVTIRFRTPNGTLNSVSGSSPPFSHVLRRLRRPIVSKHVPTARYFRRSTFRTKGVRSTFRGLQEGSEGCFRSYGVPIRRMVEFRQFPKCQVMGLKSVVLGQGANVYRQEVVVKARHVRVVHVHLTNAISTRRIILGRGASFEGRQRVIFANNNGLCHHGRIFLSVHAGRASQGL